jgi:Aldehyde dehydrogenase family
MGANIERPQSSCGLPSMPDAGDHLPGRGGRLAGRTICKDRRGLASAPQRRFGRPGGAWDERGPTSHDTVPEGRIATGSCARPFALVSPVCTLDEAIERANALPYGPAAHGFTHSVSNAERLAEGIEAGNISINHFVARSPRLPSAVSRKRLWPRGRNRGALVLHDRHLSSDGLGSAMLGCRSCARR